MGRKNKLLVHCHAGQGRTAIIVGAYLLWANLATTADDAIRKCQAGRPKMFHKAKNQDYLRSFELYLREKRCLYPSPTQKESLDNILRK